MIRTATVEDIRPIYEMMKAYYDEAIEKRRYPLAWSEEKAVIQLGNWLWNRETGLNFISQSGEGVLLGELSQTWFGGDRMGNPHALFVKREHRNGLIARALLRRFEREAIARGAIAITWDFWAGVSDVKMIDGLMRSLGYVFHGRIYRKIFVGEKDNATSFNSDLNDGRRFVSE